MHTWPGDAVSAAIITLLTAAVVGIAHIAVKLGRFLQRMELLDGAVATNTSTLDRHEKRLDDHGYRIGSLEQRRAEAARGR